MTDINDLKFTIEPEETIEMEHFVNSDNKEKEKKIWIQVNWGFYRRRKFTIYDFNVFNDCKTLEDIQKKLDEKVKEATPIVKDTKHELSKLFDHDLNLNVYETSELSKILGAEEVDVFLNESSGGGAFSNIFHSENIDDTEWNKTVKESVRGENDVTLQVAAEGWQDDVLSEDFNYQSISPYTFYRAPLRVVEVKKDDNNRLQD